MKKFIVMTAMILLLVSTVSALKTYELRGTGDQTFEYRLNLNSIEPYKGSGFATVRSIKQRGTSISTLQLRVSGLTAAKTNQVYETWLVDEDSGYTLSLGQFATSMTGAASFAATYRGYFHEFDQIMVTLEPFPDNDPRPGRVVLSGDFADSLSLIRTRSSIYGRTIGRTSERAYVGYQSQVATNLPYRRSHSFAPY